MLRITVLLWSSGAILACSCYADIDIDMGWVMEKKNWSRFTSLLKGILNPYFFCRSSFACESDKCKREGNIKVLSWKYRISIESFSSGQLKITSILHIIQWLNAFICGHLIAYGICSIFKKWPKYFQFHCYWGQSICVLYNTTCVHIVCLCVRFSG